MLLLAQSLASVHPLFPAKEGPKAKKVPYRTRSPPQPAVQHNESQPAHRSCLVTNPRIPDRTVGKIGTRTCLLLKATDAKPKHSFSRLANIHSSVFSWTSQSIHFSQINAHKALSFFPFSVNSRQLVSRQGFCCHCFCFTRAWMWEAELQAHPAQG